MEVIPLSNTIVFMKINRNYLGDNILVCMNLPEWITVGQNVTTASIHDRKSD